MEILIIIVIVGLIAILVPWIAKIEEKSNFAKDLLLGDKADVKNLHHRSIKLNFPGVDGEPDRSIMYRGDDGVLLHLLKRIEKLEETKS